MNPIEVLKRDIERALPRVETKFRRPRREDGHWWLDSTYDGHGVTVEWSPRRGFGISTDGLGDGYGEGPDEVVADREAAAKRVVELLVQGTGTVPPSDVVLRELRAVLGFTQKELANRLGVQQAAVSRLERRSDITLGSLRRYVEALGGQLEINVRTPDGGQLRLLDLRQGVGVRSGRRA
jgi:DNA-binding Xre family transcriptional regulator